MNKLFCDDCGARVRPGDVYYVGNPEGASYYIEGYAETICQDCFDEERKSWTIPIYFTPGGRMLIWNRSFGWLKTSFWRMPA